MTTKSVRCVLASGNAGKLAELSNALTAFDIELISQKEFNVVEADETACTFVENSLIKARHASASTGLHALADDSGLVVQTLQGAPGVISARYAAVAGSDTKPTDQDNINKLLEALDGTSEADRAAYFVCVLVFLRHAQDPEPLIATGVWHGRILAAPQGEDGFGYDPVFYCPQQKMSAAAMGKEKKRSVSHRAIALEILKRQLSNSLL